MEGNRFDRLTREMAGSASRRQFLKRALAGASGGALAILGMDRAGADGFCAGYKEPCTYDDDCCTGACDGKKRRCVCPARTRPCGQFGTCCPVGTPCIDGICQQHCPPDLDCEDGDLCTINECDPAFGCVTTPVECPTCQICSEGECVPDGFMQGTVCTIEGVEGICVDGECVDNVCDDECPDCTVCFQGNCIPDASQDGSMCATPFGDGTCENGFCVTVACPDDECPPCQRCTNMGCIEDHSQDGMSCPHLEGNGICQSGECVIPPCPDGCPQCQGCYAGGVCDANPSLDGAPCSTPDGTGICDNGTCVVDQCGDCCPVCQQLDHSTGLCVADMGTNGIACSAEYPNYQCINGACVCPVDAFVCVAPAYPDPTLCVCVCPPDILCPGGVSADPMNGCVCP